MSFRAICKQNRILDFQGYHIYDNLAKFKLNGNPEQKSSVILFIFEAKKLEI